jgi:hypothetical protein
LPRPNRSSICSLFAGQHANEARKYGGKEVRKKEKNPRCKSDSWGTRDRSRVDL